MTGQSNGWIDFINEDDRKKHEPEAARKMRELREKWEREERDNG